jgi:hypothetical protein
MPDLCSIVEPVNVQSMAASGVWTGLPIARLNNSQITDAVRLAIFANYGLTAAIEQSDDGASWSSLYSQANTAGQLLDSGWITVAKRFFHVKITNGSTAQGGDIYANPQFTNAGFIDAKLCLFMQEPDTVSGGTVAISGSITAQGTFTDRSGVIAAGAVAQQIAAANTARHYFMIQNPSAIALAAAGISSTESLWVNFGAASVEGQPSIELPPGNGFIMETGFINTGLISVIAATTGHPFTAKEA